MTRRLLSALTVLLLCVTMGSHAARADAPVTVFAAASLKNALDAVATAWKTETGNEVTISYAGSSVLAKQIEQGAPAAIFVSADLDWMDYLDKRHLVDAGTRKNLLGNRLVLVAPKASTVALDIAPGFDLAGALQGGRLAMADTSSVPAGKYGKAALVKLGVWKSVESRVAQAENVRAALAFVARGETPLGIVYRTDAIAEPAVRIVGTFPDETHAPIVYPAALVAGAASPGATAFFNYLSTPAATAIFKSQGFAVLP